ncbi:MAG: PilN domain-containing protein [Phycisphaerales bacterium]
MLDRFLKNKEGMNSFLPEDYVKQRAERRTLVLTVTLFVCVMGGVAAAFLVTNRQWHDVRAYQRVVNERYVRAAEDIERLKELESKKGDLLERAEVTQALIERVPRTILLAELINRMPRQMTLMELEMESDRRERHTTRSRARLEEQEKKQAKGSSNRRGRSLTGRGGDEEEQVLVVTAPEYVTNLTILGVAPRHEDVAEYVRALQECPLLTGVELVRTEKKRISDRELHEFSITASLSGDADAREITPLRQPRMASVDSMMDGGSLGSIFDPDGTVVFPGKGENREGGQR